MWLGRLQRSIMAHHVRYSAVSFPRAAWPCLVFRATRSALVVMPTPSSIVRVNSPGDGLAVDAAAGKLLGLGDLRPGERAPRRHDAAVGAGVRDAVALGRVVPALERDRALGADDRLYEALLELRLEGGDCLEDLGDPFLHGLLGLPHGFAGH